MVFIVSQTSSLPVYIKQEMQQLLNTDTINKRQA